MGAKLFKPSQRFLEAISSKDIKSILDKYPYPAIAFRDKNNPNFFIIRFSAPSTTSGFSTTFGTDTMLGQDIKNVAKLGETLGVELKKKFEKEIQNLEDIDLTTNDGKTELFMVSDSFMDKAWDIVIKNNPKQASEVNYSVRRAHEEYIMNPTSGNLRKFSELLRKTYTNQNDQEAIRKKLGFSII